MTAQRISDRRMIVRGAMIALFCGCWLLAGLAVGQETESRRRKAPPPPAAGKKSTKQERHTTIYHLKYAEAESLARVLSTMADDSTKIAVALETNSIILAAPPQMQEQLAGLIEELDVPPARDVAPECEYKTFKLVNAQARDLAEVISTFLGPDDKIAVDERTNSILVEAPQGTLLFIDAILTKLDETADRNLKKYGPEATFRVRVVWLASGLSRDDAADPSADLKDVLDLLRLMGVKDLRQVGQVIVNSTPDGRFQIRCSPILNQRSSDLEISGEFDQQQETPTLKIELSASQVEVPPATTDGWDRRRGPERKTLVDLQTVIAAPLEHYVVLGVAPVEKMTSVFIVQVTAGN